MLVNSLQMAKQDLSNVNTNYKIIEKRCYHYGNFSINLHIVKINHIIFYN